MAVDHGAAALGAIAAFHAGQGHWQAAGVGHLYLGLGCPGLRPLEN